MKTKSLALYLNYKTITAWSCLFHRPTEPSQQRRSSHWPAQARFVARHNQASALWTNSNNSKHSGEFHFFVSFRDDLQRLLLGEACKGR